MTGKARIYTHTYPALEAPCRTGAARERVGLNGVTFLTRDRHVLSGQRERRGAVAEADDRELGHIDGVTGLAGGGELAQVRVLVARHACRCR